MPLYYSSDDIDGRLPSMIHEPEEYYDGTSDNEEVLKADGPAYAFIHNVGPQVIEKKGPLLFSTPVLLTNVLHSERTAEVTILAEGMYIVSYMIVPATPSQWALVSSIKGVLPGSHVGCNLGAIPVQACFLTHFEAGESIKIINIEATKNITLPAAVGGNNTTINASLMICKIA